MFLGRDDGLEQLREILLHQGRQAIIGVAGVGKTQLAVEYAYRHWDDGDYHFIFWANAQTTEELLISWARLTEKLGLSPNENVELLVDSVRHSLETASAPWLVVLDGVQNVAALRRFLPVNSRGHVILTSLDRELDVLGIYDPLHLHELAQSDAVTFLLRRTRRFDPEDSEIEAATVLANSELGSLPLALEQAAAYISRTRCSFREYLQSYRARRLELLESGTPTNYPSSLATSLAQSLSQLDDKSLELARILAFLNEVAIPRRLLVTGAKELGRVASAFLEAAPDNPLAIDEALHPLFDYALIQRDDYGEYRMHNLVQLAIRELTPGSLKEQLEQMSVRTYNLEITPVNLLEYESPGSEFVYGISCVNLILTRGLHSRESGELLQKVGLHLLTLANFDLAAKLLERSGEILEAKTGSSDPAMAPTLLGFALLTPRGKPEVAEKYYLQVIAIAQDERQIGLRLIAQNNLGEMYRSQKRYPEAKPLLDSSLAGRIKLFGRVHTAVSTTLNNLGNWYAGQNDYKKALTYYQEAASIRKQRLIYPNTLWANSLNNLGYIYIKLEWMKAAQKVLSEALDIFEKLYGGESSILVDPLLNLAELNRKKRRTKLARDFYNRARQIQANADQQLPFLPPIFGTRRD